MQEVSFYDNGEVVVTSARFMVPSQTYAMSGITSVRAATQLPTRLPPSLLIFVGTIVLFATAAGVVPLGGLGLLVSLTLLVGGLLMWHLQKTSYSVALRTSAGEQRALTSTNQQYIKEVIAALNEAIVHRG